MNAESVLGRLGSVRAHMVGALMMAPWLSASAQVPSFADVTGHAFGDRITQHFEMVEYLERLAAASPRVLVEHQGESWEGRTLALAIVTSPENQSRLGQIQANAQRLADPRVTTPEEAQSVFRTQPVIMWFGGSIHGNELSGSEGALRLLEHLALRTDAETIDLLRNTVILIDPMLNPDGRDAFAYLNHENLGRLVSAEREDWANEFTPWQDAKYRTGHYYFDNNRDWFATTQPETRQRVPTWLAWRPQTITDMHEMRRDREFFFYPGAPPTSPHVPEFALRWIERFGDSYAAAFDRAGFSYMTGEAYDYFYPGYTDGFGSMLGAVGMLYEQGTTRGFARRRGDESVRTFAQAIEQQYTAAIAAVRFGAANREALLREYYQALTEAVDEDRWSTRRYLVTPAGDPGLRVELARLLVRAGIEVDVLSEEARFRDVRDREGRPVDLVTVPAGTYVVDVPQPLARLVQALLDPDTPVPEDFLSEARARVDRGEDAELYDITSWSLPLLFNLTAYSTADARVLATERLNDPGRSSGPSAAPRAAYAYLIDGRHAAAVAGLFHLVNEGHRAAVTLRPTHIEGRDVPSGTVVVRVGQNDPSIHDAVRVIADRFGLEVLGVATGLADSGGFPSLGSADVIPIRAPRIAIVAGDPIDANSFGWTWHALDRVYEIPTTVLRARSVAASPLARFDVLVVPSAPGDELQGAWDGAARERVRRWVRDGGTLVTIGGASGYALAEDGLDLIALRSWYDTDEGQDAMEFELPGTLLGARLDLESRLASGYPDPELPVMGNGTRVYLAPRGPPSARRRVVGRFRGADSLRISGHAWPESLERLSEAVFLYEERVGAGRVIAFAEDPNFRGFWRGADRLFLNAVVIGPSGN